MMDQNQRLEQDLSYYKAVCERLTRRLSQEGIPPEDSILSLYQDKYEDDDDDDDDDDFEAKNDKKHKAQTDIQPTQPAMISDKPPFLLDGSLSDDDDDGEDKSSQNTQPPINPPSPIETIIGEYLCFFLTFEGNSLFLVDSLFFHRTKI